MKVRTNKFLLISIIIIIAIISCTYRSGNKNTNNFYTVKRIIDRDTFVIDNGTTKGEKIRLIGIDAPETRKSKNKDIGYFGHESTEFLKKMLSKNKVRLEYDIQLYDKYGRTLAYVYLEDGTFVNAEMIKHGYATLMTIPPNIKYVDLFVKLQNEARMNNRGLWNEK